MENQHTYRLEPYKGNATRHICPQCQTPKSFVRYVDEQGNYLSENVGRCNRESSCGYHYTPKQYFADHPTEGESRQPFCLQVKAHKPQPHIIKKEIDYIPKDLVERSFSLNNTLIDFLSCFFPVDTICEAAAAYRLGSTKKRETIYWQIDQEGKVRTGKVMGYDENGHRQSINWIHSILKKQGCLNEDFNLSQCLFGEHLLSMEEHKGKPIALVESEKTAVICSMEFPQYVWLATGGKSQLNARADILKGRKVVAFADADAVEEWAEATKKYPFISISNLFADLTEEEKQSGFDIADLVVIEKWLDLSNEDRGRAWSSLVQTFALENESGKTYGRIAYIKRKWDAYWQGGKTPLQQKIDAAFAAMCEKAPALRKLTDRLGLEIIYQ